MFSRFARVDFAGCRENGATVRVLFVASVLLAMLLVGMAFVPTTTAQAATPIRGLVVVRPGGATLYSEPDGEVVTTLATSTLFTATARTEDMLWIGGWVAGDSAAAQNGWLQTERVIAVGVELLPVVATGEALPVDGAPVSAESIAAANVEAANVEVGTEAQTTDASAITGTVASGDSRLNVRSGPGTAYAVVAQAMPGDEYPVVGRTADGLWLQIERGDRELGWVSAEYMQVAGDAGRIPVITAISPPIAPLSAETPTASVQTPVQTAASSGAAVPTLGGNALSGTLVIQSSPGGMIYGYSLESGALWPLSNGFDPAISPDGQTIAFVREGGENGIYLIDIDGSNERLIFSGRARLSSPKWSPDGQWILFTRSDGEYHCLDLGGNCITPPSGPNGEQISIPGVDSVTRYWYNLARVDRDGSNYRDIASLTSARAADWNEAGIVYQSDAGLQITNDTPDAENTLVIFDYLKPFFDDPDWQPNGGRIVYMGKEASHWELFVVNADGSGQRALTRPKTTIVDEIPSNVAPAWNADGQAIAFLSDRESNGEAGAWRVWVMDADGSNQRALPINLAIEYTFGGEQSLSWAR